MRKALYVLGVLNDSDIDWLVAAGKRREIPAGATLIQAGQPIHSIYLVIDGAFAARSAGANENARLLSGEVMGELSFVDQAPPARTIEALEPSFVLDIPRRRINAKAAEDTGFAARLYRGLSLSLAARLRTVEAPSPSESELDFDELDDLSMAGARFDWIQKRLRSA
jgi:CRP-like cAMP-binding protein